MDLNQLRYFQCVAKYEHIGKASEELHVTQPAISMSVKKLEEELGLYLFDRDRKNLRLNKCGRLFLKYINSALKDIDTGVEKVQTLNQADDSHLTIMVPSAIISTGLVSSLYEAFPELTLQNLALDYKFAKAQLGKYLDLCIISPPVEGEGIETIIVEKQRYYAIAQKDSSLASISSCHLADLANEKFVMFPDEAGPGKMIGTFFEKAGFVPDVCFECTSSRTMLPPILAGCGIGIMPIAAHGGISFDDFHIISLEDDFVYGDLALSYPKERKNDPTFSKVLEIITDCCVKKDSIRNK